jgi:quinol monooxygenase YgiN
MYVWHTPPQRRRGNMSKITVVAKIVAKKKTIESVKLELLKMIAPTSEESGCIEYRLHQDNLDTAVFLFYENWESLSCLEQHLNSAHYKNYVAAVGDQLAEKVVHTVK